MTDPPIPASKPSTAVVTERRSLAFSDGKLCRGCCEPLAGDALIDDGWLWHADCHTAMLLADDDAEVPQWTP